MWGKHGSHKGVEPETIGILQPHGPSSGTKNAGSCAQGQHSRQRVNIRNNSVTNQKLFLHPGSIVTFTVAERTVEEPGGISLVKNDASRTVHGLSLGM